MSPPLSPPARLGIHLAIGALLLVAAAWLFGAIAEDVATGDRLTVLDAVVAQWLHRHATAPLTQAMLVVSNLHSTVAIACYAALAAVALGRKRDWRRLVTVVVCVAGGLALNVLMKLAFHRARPVFDQPLLTLSSYSFPSGHVAASTIFYGLAVAWVFTRPTRWRWRALAVVGALAMVSLVAFSRMYLGVHYLSDVAAAFAEGVAWLAICLSALAAFWHRARGAP
jgi:membrane-associated phospholipid phosphatase